MKRALFVFDEDRLDRAVLVTAGVFTAPLWLFLIVLFGPAYLLMLAYDKLKARVGP